MAALRLSSAVLLLALMVAGASAQLSSGLCPSGYSPCDGSILATDPKGCYLSFNCNSWAKECCASSPLYSTDCTSKYTSAEGQVFTFTTCLTYPRPDLPSGTPDYCNVNPGSSFPAYGKVFTGIEYRCITSNKTAISNSVYRVVSNGPAPSPSPSPSPSPLAAAPGAQRALPLAVAALLMALGLPALLMRML